MTYTDRRKSLHFF